MWQLVSVREQDKNYMPTQLRKIPYKRLILYFVYSGSKIQVKIFVNCFLGPDKVSETI